MLNTDNYNNNRISNCNNNINNDYSYKENEILSKDFKELNTLLNRIKIDNFSMHNIIFLDMNYVEYW